MIPFIMPSVIGNYIAKKLPLRWITKEYVQNVEHQNFRYTSVIKMCNNGFDVNLFSCDRNIEYQTNVALADFVIFNGCKEH